MIVFNYECYECGHTSKNTEMDTMLCKCGGFMRLQENINVKGEFKPFYSEDFQVEVTSNRQMNKLYRKNGVIPLGDCKTMTSKMKHIRKHKEDIIHARYSELGLKYPKGNNVKFDGNRGEFIPRDSAA